MRTIKLGELYKEKGSNLDPRKFPNEVFEYYSIAAYDKGEPEFVEGSEIGSSKKVFEPNEILLSRIVPHIRRCWVVGKSENNRQIGSGEWIVFKSDKVHPQYLRHYLMSDIFNQMFMKTVKGVGGSLLRADPKQVARFKLNIPPLETQKKIASILDAADAYRQKTKALIQKYDELTQSLFLEMFGDPVTNPKGWEKNEMKVLCSFEKNSVKPQDIKSGDIYIGLECIEKESGTIIEKFEVERGEVKSNKFKFDSDYILYGKLRPYLNKVANPDFEGICSTDIIPIKPRQDKSNKYFIISLMRGSWFVSFANENTSGANLPRISPKKIEKYQAINPPIELQNQFADRVQEIEKQKAQAQESLEKAEELFSSLLQRAFKGEIV